MAKEIKLLDSAYVKACDFVFNYGSLAAAVIGGATYASGDVLTRHQIAGGLLLLISSTCAPGITREALSIRIQRDSTVKDNRDHMPESARGYFVDQSIRNFWAGLGAFSCVIAYKNPTLSSLGTGLVFSGLAAASAYSATTEKKELEKLVL